MQKACFTLVISFVSGEGSPQQPVSGGIRSTFGSGLGCPKRQNWEVLSEHSGVLWDLGGAASERGQRLAGSLPSCCMRTSIPFPTTIRAATSTACRVPSGQLFTHIFHVASCWLDACRAPTGQQSTAEATHEMPK